VLQIAQQIAQQNLTPLMKWRAPSCETSLMAVVNFSSKRFQLLIQTSTDLSFLNSGERLADDGGHRKAS
jgi:hypothetical protein